MTAFDRFDRVFEDVLAELAQPSYPDYIDDVLTRATTGSQRPAWTFPERWLPMRTMTRSVPFAPGLPWPSFRLLALLALLAAALVAIAIGTQRRAAPPYGPAENGVIAYGLDGDIYTRDPLGGEPRQITQGPHVDVSPVFSLDGTSIGFVRIDPDQEAFGTMQEQASLMIANADGTGMKTLLGPMVFSSWVLSPDTRSVAVLAPAQRGRQLSVVPIDGSAPRVFAFDASIVSDVAWRPPDGRELILRLASGGRGRFFAVPLDGSAVRQITRDDMVVPAGGLFTLTPDGSKIVYEHMGDVITVRILDVETGEERVFGANLPPLAGNRVHTGAPLVSSDGTKLIFGRYWDDDGQRLNHQMWTASLAGDGTDAKPIGPALRTPGGSLPFVFTAAPDGSTVIVHRTDSTETWSTNLEGANLQELDLGDFEWIDWQRLAP